jgi:hypothetical protein
MATPFRIEVNSSTGQARADITGLFNSIADLTKKISENSVDWQKILFSTLSPAMLVGDLGRTLQIAMDATMEFENVLGNAVSNAAGNFTGNMKSISEMAANMTKNMGTSITDNASAIAYLSKTWGENTGVMNAILSKAGEASVTTFTQMGTAVQVFSQVLQSWGVTSAQDAAKAMDAIVKGVQNGNIPLEKFAATLIQSKSGLSQYHVSIEDAAAALSALSTQAGLTGDQAISIFTNFANVINTQTNPAGVALLQHVNGIQSALNKGDIINALAAMETYFSKNTTEVGQLGQQVHISTDNINAMKSLTVSSIDAMKKKAEELKTAMEQDLIDPLGRALTTVEKLRTNWNQLIGDFTGGLGDKMLQLLNGMITAADAVVRAINSALPYIYADETKKQTTELVQQNTAMVGQSVLDQLSRMFQQAGYSGGLSALGSAGGSALLSRLQSMDIGRLGILQSALLYPSQSNISTVNNTFGINISVTAGETSSQISNAIVRALYARFQGMGK